MKRREVQHKCANEKGGKFEQIWKVELREESHKFFEKKFKLRILKQA
jgi:hypothetical protein